MTSDQLLEALERGSEQGGVEFKGGGPRSEKVLLAKVLKAVMAMANRRDGGVVVLGVEERDGALARIGISAADAQTWGPDHLADSLASYASPPVDFRIESCLLDEGTFLVITVQEFLDSPVLCKKTLSIGGQVVLREGACYVRPRHKPESSEVATYVDMRDLLDRAAEKGLRRIVRGVRSAGIELEAKDQRDDAAFAEQERDLEAREIVTKIKSRGHWRVVIRPARFEREHVAELGDLESIVTNSSVDLRGWDFPHIDRRNPVLRGLHSIEQSTDWHHHVELWSLSQSGQFVFLGGLWDDWRDVSVWGPAPEDWRPGARMTVNAAVFFYTEVCEFAARFAITSAGAEQMIVDTTLFGLKERQLVVGNFNRSEFHEPKVAHIGEFRLKRTIDRGDLIAKPTELALDIARQLFMRFGWDVSHEDLKGFQEEIRR